MIRKLLFFVLALLPATMAMAQSDPERSDFTFKSSKVLDANGEVSHVKVGAYIGKKLVKEMTYEIFPPLSVEVAEHVGAVSEADLNFDGYPDADIYLGYWGGFANNTQHEALLWDQTEHCFVEADGYSGIGEPVVDEERQCILTTLSAGPDHRVTTYYKWQANKLIEYLSNTWVIEGDDYVSFDGVMNYPCYRFDARLDGRIPVNIVFQRSDEDIVAGYIYYPKAKTPAPIMIMGSVTSYNGTDHYALYEYQADGIITGNIHIAMSVDPNTEEKLQGTWTNPKTRKEMVMQDLYFNHEAPRWFTQSLLTPEDPGNIGREYSFQEWNLGAEDYMGGHITFRAAGKNKVHFECGNVRHNIAEGRSDNDRPAQLKGNVFEYRDVNECGYGFRATFFPRFVVLETITPYSSLDCFGAGAAFDGVYIKVKQ